MAANSQQNSHVDEVTQILIALIYECQMANNLFHRSFILQGLYSTVAVYHRGYIPHRLYTTGAIYHTGYIPQGLYTAEAIYRLVRVEMKCFQEKVL